MNLALAAVFLLSLVFLVMVYGEKLSLVEFFDGRWLTATSDKLAESWDRLCDGLDAAWCFVTDHCWWVTAAASGTTGVVLIALMMFSGLSEEAQAVRFDDQTLLNAGSVLDYTPIIGAVTRGIPESPGVLPEAGVSNLVEQFRSLNRYRLPEVDLLAEYPERNDLRPEISLQPDSDFPPLFEFDDLRRNNQRGRFPEPVLSRETDRNWLSGPELRLSIDPTGREFALRGRPIAAPALTETVQRAITSLRWTRDDWLASAYRLPRRDDTLHLAAPLREDSEFAVRDLQARVDVIPGRMVASSDLRVEKVTPEAPADGGFSVQIRVQNTGRGRISGLLLREVLPIGWQPTNMQPAGVYRSGIVTWLIDELDPLAERVYRLDLTSDRPGRYESLTEISAVAAVTSPTTVQSGRSTNRSPLPPVRRPDVRLKLEKPVGIVPVGKVFEVYFNLTNVGTIAAEGVDLRVTLDRGLGHHTLDDAEPVRRIENGIARLAAGDSRRIVLKLRAIRPGLHIATAEMLLQEAQLDLVTFEVDADDRAPTDRPPDTRSPRMFE